MQLVLRKCTRDLAIEALQKSAECRARRGLITRCERDVAGECEGEQMIRILSLDAVGGRARLAHLSGLDLQEPQVEKAVRIERLSAVVRL